MGDLREPNCVAAEESVLTSSSSSLIGPERWAKAEEAAQKIIYMVQPTTVSEERRRQVTDYVQRLIRRSLGCEVFPYGSVPLKTYLPDGDIDLTAFGGTSVEDVLANDMVYVLEGEDQNGDTEFAVKDVQLIRAEVKLVKCIVQNIVVDISFNQIGGLCTLCFLEQVDRLIGNNHLFKRSILLIKAWCYYESRILGAHHGLISTYALETLVLYIFHLFHSTLDGPLAVLYKFLDYFSKFDWENYCISLTGPVRISSLPEIVAETPENGDGDFLLSSDFLRYCIDMFSVPSRGADMGSRTFPQKHLNIVDPLKENNNLGRSVSKGNFYRIRSAFNYGARKLGRILVQPEDFIANELHKFFSNTIERHGHGRRPDVQDPAPLYYYSCSNPTFAIPESESSQTGEVISEAKTNDLAGTPEGCRNDDPDISSQYGVDDTRASEIEAKICVVNEGPETRGDAYHPGILSETNGPVAGNVLNHHHLRYRDNSAGYRLRGCIISGDDPKVSASSSEQCVSAAETTYHVPHLCSSNSLSYDAEINSDSKQLRNCKESMFSKGSRSFDEGVGNIGCSPDDNMLVGKDDVLAGRSWDVSFTPSSIPSSEDTFSVNQQTSSGSPEPDNPLSDLSGDYDSHFNCLQYGRWCYEYGSGTPIFAIPPTPPPFQMKISLDPIQHASLFKRNGYSHGNANGVFPSPAFYTVNHLVMPSVAAYGLEDMPKPRGTGTYFPNMSRSPHGYRPWGKGRSQAASRSPRNNGRTSTFRETSNHDRSRHELGQAEVGLDQSGMKQGSLDGQQLFSPRGKGHPKVNGAVNPTEGLVEFGSEGVVVPVGAGLAQKPMPSSPQNSSPVSPTLGMQGLRPVFSRDYDRVSLKSSYRLRDEDDFPPLSV